MMFVLLLVTIAVLASASPLGPYRIADTTVSGLSSGAFMAVQTHVVFSDDVRGAAIFAGGPYYCAGNNALTAVTTCMKGDPLVAPLVAVAQSAVRLRNIDSLTNLHDDKVFLFAGKKDSTVHPQVMHRLEEFYAHFVPAQNIVTQYDIEAEHTFPTLNHGDKCDEPGETFIGNCGYDGAGEAFKVLFGAENLSPPTAFKPENLLVFDQRPFNAFPMVASLAETGFIYVPTACAQGATCHLHFAFHGCKQNLDKIGNAWAMHTGYNGWAEANNIIVVYPYAQASALNPNGCWDWWGYTQTVPTIKNYATKSGVQMEFFHKLYKAITGGSTVKSDL